ncbi:hypothetical protein [Streptomyces sasae]|uniref:hypothetical protein n=1 Tax=Streptomyces sasae TaxID=1266772 RepID=UPI00292D2D53|nr:hypothetical protein [Streptomyces sasae]
MRLSTPLSLCVAVAAAAVLAPVPTATALSAVEASCAGADAQGFPLTTRIHDGTSVYDPGGGFGTWYLDLTNTTRRTCTDIHPVVVLVDDKRVLKASQTELEFYDGPHTRPVRLEPTDQSELVGVFDGNDFPGFSLAPGATVSVKVRLAVTSDAVTPNAVTVNAAAVQRHGSDGAWVGESNDYRFGIGDDPPPAPSVTPAPSAAPATPAASATPSAPATATDADADTMTATAAVPATDSADSDATPGSRPGSGSGRSSGTGPVTGPGDAPNASPGSALPFAEEAEEAGERARELARTGVGLAHGLFTAALALVTVGAGAFLVARRRR